MTWILKVQIPFWGTQDLHLFHVRAGAIVLVCIAVPWVLPTLVPLLIGFAYVRKRYITTSREVKRFDAVTRSPIYASFGATLKVCPIFTNF